MAVLMAGWCPETDSCPQRAAAHPRRSWMIAASFPSRQLSPGAAQAAERGWLHASYGRQTCVLSTAGARLLKPQDMQATICICVQVV